MNTKVTKRKVVPRLLTLAGAIFLLLAFLLAAPFVPFGNSSTISAQAATQHQSSDLFFIRVAANEYGVGLINQTLQHVDIPNEHNGLPVTQIIPNGFAFSMIQTINIPESVHTIGSGAFMGTDLEFVNLSAVTRIESFAFAMAQSLTTVALPETVENVGPQAFLMSNATIYTPLSRSDAIARGWSSAWDLGREDYVNWSHLGLAADFVPARGGYRIVRYMFANTINNSDINIFIDNHNGYPIIEIASGAFMLNTSNSINVGLYSSHQINVLSNAFANSFTNVIRLGNNVIFEDINNDQGFSEGFSTRVFSNSTAHTIYLPNSITIIPCNMFQNMNHLTAIRFQGLNDNELPNITKIGEWAFASMFPSILTLNHHIIVPSSLRYVGLNAFAAGQRVFIDKTQAQVNQAIVENRWNPLWNAGGATIVGFRSAGYRITLNTRGGINGTQYIDVMPNSQLPTTNITAPTSRTGFPTHIFLGYFSQPYGQGIPFFNRNMARVYDYIWNRGTMTMYAHWGIAGNNHTITLIRNAMQGSSSFGIYAGGRLPTNLTAPHQRITITGNTYSFRGYFSAANGQGTQFFNATMQPVYHSPWSHGSTRMYAYWAVVITIIGTNPPLLDIPQSGGIVIMPPGAIRPPDWQLPPVRPPISIFQIVNADGSIHQTFDRASTQVTINNSGNVVLTPHNGFGVSVTVPSGSFVVG